MKFSLVMLAAAAASDCAFTTCAYEPLGDGHFRTTIATTMDSENFSCGKVEGTTNTCACECADHLKCTMDHATGDGTRVQRDHCAASAPEPSTAPAGACPKTYQGMCVEHHAKLLAAGTPAATHKECYDKCAGNPECGGMFFHATMFPGKCHLYRAGCTQQPNDNWSYYAMDTCTSPDAIGADDEPAPVEPTPSPTVPAPAPAPSVCPVTWNGGCTNFHGKQLGTVPATTLKECHSKCAATAGCGAMFFSPADRTSCQLYRTGCIKNAGAVTWTYYLMDTCVSPPDTVVPLP